MLKFLILLFPATGDMEFKQNKFLPAEKQIVTADPDINIVCFISYAINTVRCSVVKPMWVSYILRVIYYLSAFLLLIAFENQTG